MAYCYDKGIDPDEFRARSQNSRDEILGYGRERARSCPGCGTHPEEWDPRLGGDEFAYETGMRRCLICADIEQEKSNIPDHARGVHVTLRTRWDAERHPDDTEEVVGG